MVKLKEILGYREIDMLRHFQWRMLNTDIEDLETIESYQNEIFDMINKAIKRYYKENPSILSFKNEKSKGENNKNNLKVRDLLTSEEEEEIDFLQWRLTKTLTPWGRTRKQKRINAILEEVLKRNGYE